MSRLVHAALLGTLQGLTEFLPVSSTAHLLVGRQALGFEDPGDAFTIMIQFGSILAVMWVYRAKIARLVLGLLGGGPERRFALAILAAFVPTALAGILLADFVEGVLFDSFVTIAVALILGGIVMLVVERLRPEAIVREADQVPIGRAVGVGLCQTLALVPGVSRSGGTIVGGMLMGLDRRAAAEFSFFLAMPTLAAAFARGAWLIRHQTESAGMAAISVGFVMAFLSALVVVQVFLRVVGRSGFAPFAWYRIAAGGCLLAAIAAGWI